MVDPLHGTIENSRQALAAFGNRRAVAFNDAPVHAGIVIVVEIARRNAVQLGAADVCPDCADQIVPAAIRREKCGCRNVGVTLGPLSDALEKIFLRFAKFALRVLRKSVRKSRARPWRPRFVDGSLLLFGDSDPGVTIG